MQAEEPEDGLRNPFWHALRTEHAALAEGRKNARRYPTDVIPFAGLAADSVEALSDLRELLAEGEAIYVMSSIASTEEPSSGAFVFPALSGLEQILQLSGLQMLYTASSPQEPSPASAQIARLGETDIPAMLALKKIAFPGYFGARAATLGTFYGVRAGEQLVAMAGERLALPGAREISAVCTHPGHTGKGYAAALMQRILREHAETGLRSFLQVVASNARAIALYERLGFTRTRAVMFRRLRKTAAAE